MNPAAVWSALMGRRRQVEGLPAAKHAGAAGADATDGGQVGVMEDGQLDGQTAPRAGREPTTDTSGHMTQ